MTKRDPPDGTPPWAVELFERVARLETKMNLISYIAGTTFVTLLTLILFLMTGVRIA